MRSTKDNLVVLGVLGILVIAAIVFVYIPQGKKLKGLEVQIVLEKTKLAGDSQKAAIVPALFQSVNSMRTRYEGFDSRLPKKKELGEFLGEISGYLATQNISGQWIEPGSPTQEELFHTLPIIMRFNGSYLAVGSLLNQIDKMQRLTRVERLIVRHASAAGDDKNDLEIELQLNIYFTES